MAEEIAQRARVIKQLNKGSIRVFGVVAWRNLREDSGGQAGEAEILDSDHRIYNQRITRKWRAKHGPGGYGKPIPGYDWSYLATYLYWFISADLAGDKAKELCLISRGNFQIWQQPQRIHW